MKPTKLRALGIAIAALLGVLLGPKVQSVIESAMVALS